MLVLDEPFAGLDPIVCDLLTEVLREQAARGVPVLFSSHQLELVEHICESVAIIDHGRLIACGAVDELRAADPDDPGGRRGAGDWTAGLAGVEVVERGADGVVIELGREGLPAGARRRAARGPGALRRGAPDVAELFRDLVAA